MTDTDQATQVEDEERGGDCLKTSVELVALLVFVAWSVAQWVMA